MVQQWSLKELNKLPTIEKGHTDDLKIVSENGKERVWLSRMTIEDGQPYNNQVTIEVYLRNKWIIKEQYEAL